MMKTVICFAVTIAGIFAAGGQASAVPILVETTHFGGHTYELWAAPYISWADAQNNAEARGGYLAVLTAEAETLAVYNALAGTGFFLTGDAGSQDTEAWLGAIPLAGSTSTTSNSAWQWVNGEAWTAFDSASFAEGEPNGDSEGLAINRFGSYFFNDEGGHVGGYIVERAPDGGTTASLLGLTLGTVAFFRRKLMKA